MNRESGITRDNAYLDDLNYLRWKSNGRLCHREIAYKHRVNATGLPFRYCDVHHRDENKWNDVPTNLEILARSDHEERHDKRARHREREHPEARKCGKATCAGCGFYNEFDRACQKQ